jgi:hypothetical protein
VLAAQHATSRRDESAVEREVVTGCEPPAGSRESRPHRQAPDHQRLGLSPNRVSHVDDAGNEDGEQDVVLELFLERADDRGGSHCPGQSDEEPRQAMPEPPAHVLLGRLASVLGAGETAAQPGDVLVVLCEQYGHDAVGRDEPHELALPFTTATLDSFLRTIAQATLSCSASGVTTGGSGSISSASRALSAAAMRTSIGTMPTSRRPSRTATSSAQS